MKEWVKRIWNDSVWSKVIAAGIISAIGAAISLAKGLSGNATTIPNAFKEVFCYKINVWLAIGIVIVVMLVRSLYYKYKEKNQKVPIPPFVNEFTKGCYQNLIWKWRWQWCPENENYYVADLKIVCPNCKEGVLNLIYTTYTCVKCNAKFEYRNIQGSPKSVANQIYEDALNKYDYCKEYIGK